MKSGAEYLFEEYLSKGYSHVLSLHGGAVETGNQDFKLFKSRNPNNWSADDKRNLAEALSGFANGDGGIIIWGVDCRKGPAPDDADTIQSFDPISNLTAVLATMYTLTASNVEPAVIGVRHEKIEDPANPDVGFIVSLIPRSESGPHMAMISNNYIIRAGSSFIKMTESMVSDRYGRRPQPKLVLEWEKLSIAPSSGYHSLLLILRNKGLGSAKYPSFILKENSTFKIDLLKYPYKGRNDFWFKRYRNTICGDGNHEVVIHSRREKVLVELKYYLDKDYIELPHELFADGFYAENCLRIEKVAVLKATANPP